MNGKPVGSKFCFNTENRKRWPGELRGRNVRGRLEKQAALAIGETLTPENLP